MGKQEKQRMLTVAGLKKLIQDLPDTALVVMPVNNHNYARDLRPLLARQSCALKHNKAQANLRGALVENPFLVSESGDRTSVPVLVIEEFPWEL